jgi:hypothetical protein
MAGLAAGAGLAHLIAPVRPNLKERYPTIAIGRYPGWTREDGTPFDPWIRVPSRLGTAPDRRRLGTAMTFVMRGPGQRARGDRRGSP